MGMIKTCRAFAEDTLQDALELVEARFGIGACAQVRTILRNPLRVKCRDAGAIGYRDGRPVCFQAAMLRRCHLRKKEILSIVGGMTCKVEKGCPASLLFETIDRASESRAGSVMGFGNSCCRATAAMDEESGGVCGPQSCTRYLWRAIRPLSCLSYFIRRKILKGRVPSWPAFNTLGKMDFQWTWKGWTVRRMGVESLQFLTPLMRRYLEFSEGFVCSRTEEEVVWMYGERIASGQAVVLAAADDQGQIQGYIIIGTNSTARRWMVMDWFAVRNHVGCLETLLKSAGVFLKRHTPAMMLEASGFATFIQPVLRKYLPHVRETGVNAFSWGTSDDNLKETLKGVLDTPQSWFFGPYDGDLCMV